MLIAVFKKEWIKLKYFVYGFIILDAVLLFYFWHTLRYEFATVEPESMMWYRFVHFGQKPYSYFFVVFFVFGVFTGLAQFLQERIEKRVKILLHLPLSILKTMTLHLFFGMMFLLLVEALLIVGVSFILSFYYPDEIVYVAIKDFIFFVIGSLLGYVGVSSAILDRNVRISTLKFLLTIAVFALFYKSRFEAIDTLFVIFLFIFCFAFLDSLYSFKGLRAGVIYKFLAIIGICLALFIGYEKYNKEYAKEFNRYYIFYSHILDKFVYQKNFGDHIFEYGDANGKRFDRVEYESFLPFVYWRDLDIRGKLPIEVAGAKFDAQSIKSSKLSFSYDPKMLQQNEVELYPLINPIGSIGMIPFPEEAILFFQGGVKVYNFDDELDKSLTKEIEELMKSKGVTLPIKNVWGKPVNMKPYDVGYLILDSANRLFNLKRGDGRTTLEEVRYPEGIELVFVGIGENRQKELIGYAIDAQSSFYLLRFGSFEFVKLELAGFDYKKMKLQLLADPLSYLIRYDNGDVYRVSLFDRELNFVESVKMEF